MYIITVSVTVSLIIIQLLMILKKGLLTELEGEKKILRMAIFFGRSCFGWVGRSTANQPFFKVDPILTDKINDTVNFCHVLHVAHKHELHRLTITRILSQTSGLK